MAYHGGAMSGCICWVICHFTLQKYHQMNTKVATATLQKCVCVLWWSYQKHNDVISSSFKRQLCAQKSLNIYRKKLCIVINQGTANRQPATREHPVQIPRPEAEPVILKLTLSPAADLRVPGGCVKSMLL